MKAIVGGAERKMTRWVVSNNLSISGVLVDLIECYNLKLECSQQNVEEDEDEATEACGRNDTN